jgi:hypothetical protein
MPEAEKKIKREVEIFSPRHFFRVFLVTLKKKKIKEKKEIKKKREIKEKKRKKEDGRP